MTDTTRSGSLRTRLLCTVVALPLLLWGGAVISIAGAPGGSFPPLRLALAIFWFGLALLLLLRLPWKQSLGATALFLLPPLLFFLSISPSNDRDWEEQALRSPHATIEGTQVRVHDLRAFRWAPDGTYEAAWRDETFDLDTLEESYFVLTSFGGHEALAHVMVSFRFGEEQFLVLSVEIRRERGETYNPIGGAFRQYELFYVAADERDAIGLRAFVHQDPTWLIPMNAGPDANRAFLLDMLERMNELKRAPQWYNTLTNSCATNLATHYENVNDLRLGWDRRVFLPGYSDLLLEELDLLPEGMDRHAVRERYMINERALEHGDQPGFSQAIRSLP